MPPDTQGVWLGVVQAPGDSQSIASTNPGGIYGLHAVLLRSGRVLVWSGLTEGSGYLYASWSWDPREPVANALGRWFLPEFDQGGTRASPPGTEPGWNDDHQIDMFCAHHVVLEDGRVLVIGGAGERAETSSSGNAALHLYDPVAERWSKLGTSMAALRWYPTGVTMPDGRVLVFSGRTPGGIAQSVEIVGRDLVPRVVSGGDRKLYIFPGMHMVPGGRIFYVNTSWAYEPSGDATALSNELVTASFRLTGPTSGIWDTYSDPGGASVAPVVRYREEGTSCLLPPAQDGKILLVGGSWGGNRSAADAPPNGTHAESCEILETQGTVRWTPAGDMRRRRTNVHTVLLPDGNVFIVGGHGRHKGSHDDSLSVDTTSEGHANTAEMFDPRVPYDPANVHGAFTDMATMGTSRLYHSTALLLPDGRVWVAGGDEIHAVSPAPREQKTMELYEPPYMHRGAQPGINAIDGTNGPNDEIYYGGSFTIHTRELASTFRSVVLVRPGSTSHHTNTEQRHVPLPFMVNTGHELRVHVNVDATVAPPGYYMVWALDAANLPCERALFVRLGDRRLELITDRSTFSFEEVSTITGGRVEDSLFVHVYGLTPAELGITTATPSQAQVTAWAPPITFSEGGTTITTITAAASAMLLEDPARSLALPQHITFRYAVVFANLTDFPALGSDRVLDARAIALGRSGSGKVRLTRQGNPYMTDGAVHWLSTNVRVFRVRAGEPSLFGPTIDATNPDPYGFIQGLLTEWDANQALTGHPFASIQEGQAESALQWATNDPDGVRVFNFAVARVRYRASTIAATNVRAFFRLFTTSATNLDFNIDTTYRTYVNAGRAVPRLGVIGTELVTIPFFAQAREPDMTLQHDDANVKLSIPGTGDEVRRYFGVWLDFNEDVPRFPRNPGLVDGPFTGSLESIQALIRGRHQCLVAEINVDSDPNRQGDSPANSDNLSQRNLAIIGSDNPGTRDAHTIHLTFDLTPTWHVPKKPRHPWELERFRPAPQAIHRDGGHDHGAPPHVAVHHLERTHRDRAGERMAHHGGDTLELTEAVKRRTRNIFFKPGGNVHEHPAAEDLRGPVPDELMIIWGETPRTSRATIYLPTISADEILDHATRYGGVERIERVDDHTIGLAIGDVTYLPVPVRAHGNTAGLLTITLPASVRVRQEFKIVVKHLSRSEQRVVGTFELRIPVSTGPMLLADEMNTLAVIRHVRTRIPAKDRWAPIFERYEQGIVNRVAGFGGDPTTVKPSPGGHQSKPCPRPGGEQVCPPKPCPPSRYPIADVFKVLATCFDRIRPCSCGGDHAQAEHPHDHSIHDHSTNDQPGDMAPTPQKGGGHGGH